MKISSFLKLINCHMKFLFSRVVLVIILITLLFNMGILIKYGLDCQSLPYSSAIQIYQIQSFNFLKLLLLFSLCFIGGNSFTYKSDNYTYLLLSKGYSKVAIFITKMICLTIIILIEIIIIFLLQGLIGLMFINGYHITKKLISIYLSLFCYVYFYTVLTVFLVIVIQNIYAILLVVTLSIVFDSLSDGSFLNIINIFFINLKKGETSLVYPWYYNIVLISIYLILSGVIYYYRLIKEE